ncbi:CHAT domain-containing protein [Zestomonas thermotolerans]|uniref:CHAT domain-containing protein n=1 Tax=Zestomonas thermotolerans TaxID=157784 RepID=UPI000376FDD9|nr:CHAT domain-containing protein [Pseudomonas thermotolerans]
MKVLGWLLLVSSLLVGCVAAPDPNLLRDIQVFQRYMEEGRYDEAEALARDLDRRSPRRDSLYTFSYAVKPARESGLDGIRVVEPDAFFTKAIEVLDPVSMKVEGPSDSPTGWNQRGVALYRSGDLPGAIAAFDAAERGLRAQIAALRAQGELGPALTLSEQALPVAIANRALCRWTLGQPKQALADARLALSERAAQDPLLLVAYRNERDMLLRANARQKELGALISLEQEAGAAGDSLALLAILENKGWTLQRLAQAQAAVRSGSGATQPGAGQAGQNLLARLEAFNRQRAELSTSQPSDPAQRAAREQGLADLDWEIRELQAAIQVLSRQDARAYSAAGQTQISAEYLRWRKDLVERVRSRVPGDALLVEMVRYRPFAPLEAEGRQWGAERYAAYVLGARRTPRLVDLGPAAELDDLVVRYRQALDADLPAQRFLARQLDRQLLQPVRAQADNVRQLYLAPDGVLNLLPFAALIDEQGHYQLERYTFNYLTSGRDLLDSVQSAPRGPALIVADPQFSLQGGTPVAGLRSLDFSRVEFSQLPGTAEEARALAGLLPDALQISGAEATESRIKAVAGPRILHIATHGFFLGNPQEAGENPMLRSGLVFAGVSQLRSGQDDGVLTALEASTLDLLGTQLVVLSACDTGVGQVRQGEGVFGLRRAMLQAGAQTVVMSLWQVDDQATRDLMIGYYQQLAKGSARAEALRNAQLALLRDSRTASPYYWAAFLSAGQAGPL